MDLHFIKLFVNFVTSYQSFKILKTGDIDKKSFYQIFLE